MLIEAALYGTALRCPEARPLGLVNDAVALWSRARRCRRDWALHWALCVAEVERAIATLPSGGTALVLGSGVLGEVALPALARHFERVILADAVHLLPARLSARAVGAEPVAVELSGYAAALLGRAAGRTDPLARWRDGPIAFVLSANLLSQMPRAPQRWAERHPGRARRLHADLLTDGPRRIAEDHLADLLSLRTRTCLLTDVSYRRVDQAGALLDETDLLNGMTLPEPDASWDWLVAPPGEAERRVAHIHRMHAYLDVGRTLGDAAGSTPAIQESATA